MKKRIEFSDPPVVMSEGDIAAMIERFAREPTREFVDIRHKHVSAVSVDLWLEMVPRLCTTNGAASPGIVMMLAEMTGRYTAETLTPGREVHLSKATLGVHRPLRKGEEILAQGVATAMSEKQIWVTVRLFSKGVGFQASEFVFDKT